MKTATTTDVTSDQILALETEALTAGDHRMVSICRIATDDMPPCRPGHAIEAMCSVDAARAECARVIRAAEDMDDPSTWQPE